MSHPIAAPVLSPAAGVTRWHALYRIGAYCALITVVVFLFQVAAYFLWPPPETVAGHYALLQSRPVVGLVSLDLLIIVDELLAIPLCLALYMSLRRVNESVVLIATALTGASLLCFLIGTPAFNMLYLSHKFAAATNAVERDGLLAAGQAVLSFWQGTPFQVGYVVGSIDMILIGWVMMRSDAFGKVTGCLGIVSSVVGLGVYIPKIGVLISIFSVFGMQAWYVMIALKLLRIPDR